MKKRRTIVIYLTDEEVDLLKHRCRRLKLQHTDARKTGRHGTLKDVVQNAAEVCARVEREFIDKES